MDICALYQQEQLLFLLFSQLIDFLFILVNEISETSEKCPTQVIRATSLNILSCLIYSPKPKDTQFTWTLNKEKTEHCHIWEADSRELTKLIDFLLID